MNELNIQKKTLEESEAVIKSNESFVSMGLWNIGNELKYIRDNRTYEEKGYSGFEEYTEKELNYSKRSAYNFITIASKYSVQTSAQMAHLGISKLLELAKLEEPQRDEVISTVPVDEMTTRELQRVIKEKNQADVKIKELETQLQQKPKEVEVVQKVKVVPDDYYQLQEDLETARFEKEQLSRRLKEDTDPERFQRLAQSESDARVEVRRLEKQIEAMEADSKTIEHKVKKSSITFCGKVHNFLTDVGGLAWINDYHDLLDGQERKDYLTALNAIEGWLHAIKNNIEGE